ncbi:MAG: class II SORL domain-containing protein [Chloroflexota bacterium]
MGLADTVRTADWKLEKHVPAIDCPQRFAAGAPTAVTVTVGGSVPHPNTTEHHIRWVALHFQPTGSQLTFELGRAEFAAHGESAAGANQGPAVTAPVASFTVALKQSGTLHALAYCNIHGLWAGEAAVVVE